MAGVVFREDPKKRLKMPERGFENCSACCGVGVFLLAGMLAGGLGGGIEGAGIPCTALVPKVEGLFLEFLADLVLPLRASVVG